MRIIDMGKKRLKTRPEASSYLCNKYGLQCSVATLNTYACRGKGPPYQVMGRSSYYDVADLDVWASSRISPKILRGSDRVRVEPSYPDLPARKREAKQR